MNRSSIAALCLFTLISCETPPKPPATQDGAGELPADGGTGTDMDMDMGMAADMNMGMYDPECEEFRAASTSGIPRSGPGPGPGIDRLVIAPEVATDAPVPGLAYGDQVAPAIATDGNGYLLLWADRRAEHQLDSTHSDLVAARVDRDGKLLDPSGIPVRVAPATSQSDPALAFDGRNYLAVWLQRRPGGDRTYYDVRAARIAPDGRVLDSTPITIDEGEAERYQPAVSFDGLNYLVTWYFYRPFGAPKDGVVAKRVSPEGKVLEADPIPVAAGNNLWYEIDATYAAGRHLVVWTQGKNVYGTRICRSGKVLDKSGIRLSDTGKYTRAASVTSNGSEFLAVWEIQLGDVTGPNVQATRVLPDGTVRDRPGINLAKGFLARAAWNGTDYLIPLLKERQGGSRFDLRVMRLSSTGTLLDPNGSLVAQGPDSTIDPPLHDLACGAAGCLLTWPQRDAALPAAFDVRATRLDGAGAPLDAGGLLASPAANRQVSPAIAGSGSGYLLVWQDGRSGAPLLGTRLSAAGAVLDPVALPVSSNHTRYKTQPALAYLAAPTPSYLAVWNDNRDNAYGDIYAARVSAAGAVVDPMGIRVAGSSIDESVPAVACGGGQCLVVWQQQGGGYYDIYGARISAAGVVLDPARIEISRAALYQIRPRVAWSGSHFLVVWEDLRNGGVYSTYGARVSAAGVVLDPAGIVISGIGQIGLTPEVACDGTNCMVAYLGAPDLMGGRIGPTGALIGGAATLARGPSLRTPALAFDGANYVLLWADGRSGSSYDLYEARFTPAGAALDGAGYRVADNEFDEVEPRLAVSGGAQHLIGYRRLDMTSPLGAARVRTRLITP